MEIGVHFDIAVTRRLDTDNPRARCRELVNQLVRRHHRANGNAMGCSKPRHVCPERSTEELLETIVLQGRRLRKKREDSSAVVIDDNDPEVDAVRDEPDECVAVVDVGKITDEYCR